MTTWTAPCTRSRCSCQSCANYEGEYTEINGAWLVPCKDGKLRYIASMELGCECWTATPEEDIKEYTFDGLVQ